MQHIPNSIAMVRNVYRGFMWVFIVLVLGLRLIGGGGLGGGVLEDV